MDTHLAMEPAVPSQKQKDDIPGVASGYCEARTPPRPSLDITMDMVEKEGPPTPLPMDPPVIPQTTGPLDSELGGGDVRTDGQNKIECVHMKGGVCKTHGEGAKKRWKPKWVTIIDDSGVKKREYKRQTYYECDLKPGTTDKITQPKLVLSKKTPGMLVRSDTAQGGVVANYTSTEGQNLDVVGAIGK